MSNDNIEIKETETEFTRHTSQHNKSTSLVQEEIDPHILQHNCSQCSSQTITSPKHGTTHQAGTSSLEYNTFQNYPQLTDPSHLIPQTQGEMGADLNSPKPPPAELISPGYLRVQEEAQAKIFQQLSDKAAFAGLSKVSPRSANIPESYQVWSISQHPDKHPHQDGPAVPEAAQNPLTRCTKDVFMGYCKNLPEEPETNQPCSL
ncbi:hypothetical protein Anapl_03614 [Anas platyrhynchos]|uniref:Uncharacterized protein n=1 Tax=Anas platyrhynchos TaxID=8839 RepID=R0LNZ7_ANAPL|nr:hypothetical protein Anapl_03614 [Anas platyrhynchos]